MVIVHFISEEHSNIAMYKIYMLEKITTRSSAVAMVADRTECKKGKGQYSSSCGNSTSELWDATFHIGSHMPPDISERAPPNPSHAGWYSMIDSKVQKEKIGDSNQHVCFLPLRKHKHNKTDP